MFDEFIVDAEGYERLSHSRGSGWVGGWPEVMRVLQAEGALSIVDLRAAARQKAAKRGAMLRADMKRPAHWAYGMLHYDGMMNAAGRTFRDSPVTALKRFRWRYRRGDLPGLEGTDGQVHYPSAAILDDAENP